MVLAKEWILKASYEGMPKFSDYEMREYELDENLKDGEFLYDAVFISVDPYLRAYTELHTGENIGKKVTSLQISRVTKSKNPKVPVGSIVLQNEGWCTKGKNTSKMIFFGPYDIDEKFMNYCTGVLGMTGFTAYFGLIDICQPKEGETVMVTGGAGAVGSVVGQIAKIKGCRVIGSAGSDEKVAHMKANGFDDAFNYKTTKDWTAAVKKMAPKGVDCFFDNVGGMMADSVFKNMNKYGRVACCGCISVYTDRSAVNVPMPQMYVIRSEITMKGFIVRTYFPRFNEAYTAMKAWVLEGKLKSFEHINKGFENLPKTFIEMLQGKNIGKAVVQV